MIVHVRSDGGPKLAILVGSAAKHTRLMVLENVVAQHRMFLVPLGTVLTVPLRQTLMIIPKVLLNMISAGVAIKDKTFKSLES